MRLPPVPAEGENAWPRGQEVARDLIRATAAAMNSSSGGTAPVAAGEGWLSLCGVAEARRSVEIGFGMHASSRLGGARVALPVADRAAGVQVDSRPWGNLPAVCLEEWDSGKVPMLEMLVCVVMMLR